MPKRVDRATKADPEVSVLALVLHLLISRAHAQAPLHEQVPLHMVAPKMGLICTWNNMMLISAADVRAVAMKLTSPEDILEFRRMIGECQSDPDAFLGGMISAFDEYQDQVTFAERFGVEDPVYGTPAQMKAQSRHLKDLLSVLGRRGLAVEALRQARVEFEKVTVHQAMTLKHYALSVPRPVAEELFEIWDVITNRCDRRVLSQPKVQP